MVNLIGKYIPNVKGKLRDLYIAECKKQGYTAYTDDTLIDGWIYLVEFNHNKYMGSAVRPKGYTELILADFDTTPIWNNKRIEDMNKEEYLAFASDVFNDRAILHKLGTEWLDLDKMKPYMVVDNRLLKVKTKENSKLLELEETIKKAQKQIDQLKGEL